MHQQRQNATTFVWIMHCLCLVTWPLEISMISWRWLTWTCSKSIFIDHVTITVSLIFKSWPLNDYKLKFNDISIAMYSSWDDPWIQWTTEKIQKERNPWWKMAAKTESKHIIRTHQSKIILLLYIYCYLTCRTQLLVYCNMYPKKVSFNTHCDAKLHHIHLSSSCHF